MGDDDTLEQSDDELLLSGWRNPKAFGTPASCSAEVTVRNPLCGDEITLYRLPQIDSKLSFSWTGSGCVVSQAIADAAVCSWNEAGSYEAIAALALLWKTALTHPSLLTEAQGPILRALSRIGILPLRRRCGLLIFDCLERILRNSTAS